MKKQKYKTLSFELEFNRQILLQNFCLRCEKASFAKARVNIKCCKTDVKMGFSKKCNVALVNSLCYKYDEMCFNLIWMKSFALALLCYHISDFCLSDK